jgi:hypothetical protein
MIFQHTVDLVLSGRKTQTRRVIKPNEAAVRTRDNEIQSILHNNRTKWVVGKIYAVQPARAQTQVAQIKITGLSSESVGRISNEDALAEGFDSPEAFFEVWKRMHGEDSLELQVWVVTFELVGIVGDVDQSNQIGLPQKSQ